MIAESDIRQLCQRLGCSQAAPTVIATIQAAPPARRVRSAAGNVSVRYPSRKMGVIIQAESHRNELAGIYEMEHDPHTLAYYDQPPPIKLTYLGRHGRQVGVFHTPDFFVIRTNAIGWDEWKLEAELLRLHDRMPHRYVRTADGQWRCPPGEQYAAPFGFTYRVRSSAEIEWVLQRNLQFLADYLHPTCPPVPVSHVNLVTALVTQSPGILLSDLLELLPELGSDALYTLIAAKVIYVDIHTVPLAEPDRVPVFATAAVATMHQAAIVAPHATGATPPEPVSPLTPLPSTPETAEARELLAHASPTALAEADRRYRIIAPLLHGHPTPADPTPARTVRRWVAAYRHAAQAYGMGLVGLLPQLGRSGNRASKLPIEAQRLLDEHLTSYYESPTRPRKAAVYGRLVHACAERGIPAPSYKTFAIAVRRRPQHAQQLQREGSRAAYPHEPLYWELELTTPRHGDRPWEIVHLDHTELDIELVCSRTGRVLGRPWATFLVDAFSRRILATALSFDPPSYRSCMRILRRCVQRYGRLPQILVVDGGKEFASIYLETLLAQYEVTKKTRPGAKPRFGAVIERLFGTTHTNFIYNLAGNTQAMREVRQLSGAVDPKRLARWTLDRFSAALDRWIDEVYDTTEHPALGLAPREAWSASLSQTGPRAHRHIPYTEVFRMATLPTTPKGTAKVQPNLGVKIWSIYYWADVLRDPAVEGCQVPIRYDPDDVGVAYAFVQGRWVPCISEQYARLAGRSEREIQLASAELHRRHQQHAGRFAIRARALGEFLVSLEAEELLLDQRLRDLALRDLTADPHRSPDGHARADHPPTIEPSRAALAADPSAQTAASQPPLLAYEDY